MVASVPNYQASTRTGFRVARSNRQSVTHAETGIDAQRHQSIYRSSEQNHGSAGRLASKRSPDNQSETGTACKRASDVMGVEELYRAPVQSASHHPGTRTTIHWPEIADRHLKPIGRLAPGHQDTAWGTNRGKCRGRITADRLETKHPGSKNTGQWRRTCDKYSSQREADAEDGYF